MAEYKQYITQNQDSGTVMISEDVIATIVTQAISEVDGIAGLSIRPVSELAELIGKGWNRGMKILISENNELTITCYVIIEYNQSVIDIAQSAQVAVTSAVESVTGVKVSQVNINVVGIARQ